MDSESHTWTSGTLLVLTAFLGLCIALLFRYIQTNKVLSTPAITNNQHNIAIVGPMNSGKTTLWSRLRFGSPARTQTSMRVNGGMALPADGIRYNAIDIPGHTKFIYEVDKYIAQSRAVVFVIDSGAVLESIREYAEYLYDVLVSAQRREVPVLAVCNKQDMYESLRSEKIRDVLACEIDKLRVSRQAALGSIGADDEEADEERAGDFLGIDGKRFDFDDLASDVQFNEAALVIDTEQGGFQQIMMWISQVLS